MKRPSELARIEDLILAIMEAEIEASRRRQRAHEEPAEFLERTIESLKAHSPDPHKRWETPGCGGTLGSPSLCSLGARTYSEKITSSQSGSMNRRLSTLSA